MNTTRRWYIYLVCAISLYGLLWAVIQLLQTLVASNNVNDSAFIALQIAVILVTLPVFIGHWLWAQRLAHNSSPERESLIRGIYHYWLLATLLAVVVSNAFDGVTAGLRWLTGQPVNVSELPLGSQLVRSLIAIAVAAVLWFYQRAILQGDWRAAPLSSSLATIKRLYVLWNCAFGLVIVASTCVSILYWLLNQFNTTTPAVSWQLGFFCFQAARILIGLPLWLIFWRQAQQLFQTGGLAEQQAALRRFYLYLIVFLTALSAVTSAGLILTGLLRQWLQLPTQGDFYPFAVIAVTVVFWVYHAQVLRHDSQQVPELTQQGGIRRLYWYLVAAIGLAALLVGIAGNLNVLIRALQQGWADELKSLFAPATAAIIVGLPVWLLGWLPAQREATAQSPVGAAARTATTRKFFLYAFQFIAALAVLFNLIYLLYQVLLAVFDATWQQYPTGELAQAIAYALVGVLVWVYHWLTLRTDNKLQQADRAAALKDLRLLILDVAGSTFGTALRDKLQQEEPGLQATFFQFPLADEAARQQFATSLATASAIVNVLPLLTNAENGIQQAIAPSAARKIIVPQRTPGWELAGVDWWSADDLVRQTVLAIQQWLDGETIRAKRTSVVGLVIVVIVAWQVGTVAVLALLWWIFNR